MTTPVRRRDELRSWTTIDPATGKTPAKTWREAARMTMVEAAANLKVNVSTLVNWEAGRSRPVGRNIAAYHKFLRKIRPRDEEVTSSE